MSPIRLAFLIACLLTSLPASLRAGEAAPTHPPRPGAIVLEGTQPALPPSTLPLPHSGIRFSTPRPLTPIPFQIDERDRRGRWVIKAGPRPSRDDQPGRFDPNDAIIFLRRDMGQRGHRGSVFSTGATRWHEVRLGSQEAALGFVLYSGGNASESAGPALLRSLRLPTGPCLCGAL